MGWIFRLPDFHTQIEKQSDFTLIKVYLFNRNSLFNSFNQDMKHYHKLIIMATVRAKYL